MAESQDTSAVDNDPVLLITKDIIHTLELDENENKDHIVNDLLENGRQSLVKYKEEIIPDIYTEVMTNDDKLINSLKKHIERKWQKEYANSHPWFVSFLEQYRSGENHHLYDRIVTRAAEFGNKYMKNCPILSIVLQLLFEDVDDKRLKETNIFDDLWLTITNDGLKSITKYSDYIIIDVMNEQLDKSQSILFKALREYYHPIVVSLLTQHNITIKDNLRDLALESVAEYGWLTEAKEIESKMTPRSYKLLLEKLHSRHDGQKLTKRVKSPGPNDGTKNDEAPKDGTQNDEAPKDGTQNDEAPKDGTQNDEAPKR